MWRWRAERPATPTSARRTTTTTVSRDPTSAPAPQDARPHPSLVEHTPRAAARPSPGPPPHTTTEHALGKRHRSDALSLHPAHHEELAREVHEHLRARRLRAARDARLAGGVPQMLRLARAGGVLRLRFVRDLAHLQVFYCVSRCGCIPAGVLPHVFNVTSFQKVAHVSVDPL